MARGQILLLFAMVVGAHALAAPPQLYRQPAYESPVRGEPDDLLLIAGYGFSHDDTVVYRSVDGSVDPLTVPAEVPARSNAELGIAPVVSSADAPYSLTIKLPGFLRADQTYALWVRTAHGQWSGSIKINDARPLWFSPAYVYASAMPGYLPRELKVVGRNLRPGPGHATSIRLIGPEQFTGIAVSGGGRSGTLNDYVARAALPPHLKAGSYRIMVSRDGASWVAVEGQSLEVLADPIPGATFSPGDPQYGGCRPDDEVDDTPCIVRAIAAADRAGGGTVIFGTGTWDLIDNTQPGLIPNEGILVPAGVLLRGAGSMLTRMNRHAGWNSPQATAAFTLLGHNVVTGFTFHDLQVYRAADRAGPFLQLGENWQRVGAADAGALLRDVVIARNEFDKPMVAIASGGLPIDRLLITYNTFGAYNSALELVGDQFNVAHGYRIDDSIVDYNVFKPGSELDLATKTGTIASELGAGHRVDFSGNTADGASIDYLYSPEDAKGWRAAHFWSPNGNVEQVLVSQNTATCTGDKLGDGEAIAFDNNVNAFALSRVTPVANAGAASVAIAAPLVARQHNRDLTVASYYVGHWLQVVSGPGIGQARKITGYSTDAVSHLTTFRLSPGWDVVPVPGDSRISIGREYWQLYVLDNQIDNRQPLCQKSNRSRRVAGIIAMWGQSTDSVFSGNRQYDSDGIFVQQAYGFVRGNFESEDHPCADCTVMGFFNGFMEIRDNLIDGEFDWRNDCSHSGIGVGAAAATWAGDGAPPTVGFGISISHNTIRRADAEFGGAIAQVNTWSAGPEPHRWPLSDNLLIHHNAIVDIDGPRAMAICGKSRPRIGIVFPDPAIAWRTVLYANSCRNVSVPIGPGGIDTVSVCPSSVPDSCECPSPGK